jgi:O-antigen/teichoic acid export membrane protein
VTASNAGRRSLASDSLYNALSFSVRAVFTVVGMAWVARALGPENQGRFGFAHWAGAILAQLTLLGLAPTTTRFVARALGGDRPREAAAVVSMTGRWLLQALAVAVPAALIAAFVFGAELRDALLLAALYPLTMSTYLWRIAVAWGVRRFDVALRGHLVFFAVLLPGFWLGLNYEHPVLGVLVATLVARAAHAGVVWMWTRVLPPRAPVAPELRVEVRSYAWDMAAVALVTALLWERSELVILKAWAPWHDVGLYTAAFGLSALVIRVPSMLAVVLMPFVAELQGADKHTEIGEAFARGARLLTLGLAGPTVVAAVAAPALVEVVYGAEYAGAVAPLRILLLPLALGGFGGAASKTMIGAGAARLLLAIESGAVFLKFAVAAALVPALGAVGAAIGCSVGQALALLVAGLMAGRRFGRPAQRGWPRQIAVVLIAAGAASAVAFEGPAAAVLGAQVAAGGAGWIGSALLLRPLMAEDSGARWTILQRFEHRS